MGQNTDIEAIREQLGLPNAPVVSSGLAVVYQFFTQKLRSSPRQWIPYLKGIDFHWPVYEVELKPPDELVRHIPDDAKPKPFLYFAQPGVSPMRTGTNFPKVAFERYAVERQIFALKSIASSIAFGPADRIVRPGGATQFIIPASDFSALRRI